MAVLQLDGRQFGPDDLADKVLVRGGVGVCKTGRHPGEAQGLPVLLLLLLLLPRQGELGDLAV